MFTSSRTWWATVGDTTMRDVTERGWFDVAL